MRFALLAALAPAFAVQGNDAEKLFRDLERKITSAKSLRVAAEVEYQGKGKQAKFTGSLTLGQGDKARVKMKGDFGGKETNLDMVSDGTKLQVTVQPFQQTKEEPIPKKFRELLNKMMSRTGLLGSLKLARKGGPGQEDPDPDKLLHVQDFKTGEPAKVGGRDAKVLHYRLDHEGNEHAKITLWLDAKTLLPLKRVVVPEKEGEGRITETYKEFTLNPQLDAKTFELSR